MAEQKTPIKALQDYFGDITITELKALSSDERRELAEAVAREKGWEIVSQQPVTS